MLPGSCRSTNRPPLPLPLKRCRKTEKRLQVGDNKGLPADRALQATPCHSPLWHSHTIRRNTDFPESTSHSNLYIYRSSGPPHLAGVCLKNRAINPAITAPNPQAHLKLEHGRFARSPPPCPSLPHAPKSLTKPVCSPPCAPPCLLLVAWPATSTSASPWGAPMPRCMPASLRPSSVSWTEIAARKASPAWQQTTSTQSSSPDHCAQNLPILPSHGI